MPQYVNTFQWKNRVKVSTRLCPNANGSRSAACNAACRPTTANRCTSARSRLAPRWRMKYRPKFARSSRKRRARRATTCDSTPHRYQAERLAAKACHQVCGWVARRRSARKNCTLPTSPNSVQNPNHLRRARMSATADRLLCRQLRVVLAIHEVEDDAHHERDDDDGREVERRGLGALGRDDAPRRGERAGHVDADVLQEADHVARPPDRY